MFRIGIIGAGKLGHRHVQHLSKLQDVEFVIFDTDGERARTLALQCGGIIAQRFEDVLDQVDAVDVLTPNNVHAELANVAIRSGKHVFIEKPLAHNLADGALIVEAAATSSSVAMVGHVLRYFAAYKAGRDSILSGSVGTPAAIRLTRGGAVPSTPDSWFQNHRLSGGVFIDLGVHDFDWIRWTFGRVTKVVARSVGATTMRGVDYGLATLTLESGAVAHVESVWIDPSESRMAFEVCGSQGMIEFDSRISASVRRGAQLEHSTFPEDDPYFLQLQNFVSACRGEIATPVTVTDGYEALKIAAAALESATTGQPVLL